MAKGGKLLITLLDSYWILLVGKFLGFLDHTTHTSIHFEHKIFGKHLVIVYA